MTTQPLRSADAQNLLEISDLAFAWKNGEPDIISIGQFSVMPGERLFIRGPSGSGKTTLLSLIGGVLSPRSGSIRLLGTKINQLKNSRRDTFRADHIGFIFQMFNLIPYLSLQDNVVLPCRFSRSRRSAALQNATSLDEEAGRLLSALGIDLSGLNNRPVAELSVGQQQRVAACRALIGSPELIIADEPTSALDHDARSAFLELLFREVESAGSTLLFVSHDQSLASQFDRSVSLADLNQATAGSV